MYLLLKKVSNNLHLPQPVPLPQSVFSNLGVSVDMEPSIVRYTWQAFLTTPNAVPIIPSDCHHRYEIHGVKKF